jgi:hypothetical protein
MNDDGRIVALSPDMDSEIKEEFAAVRADLRNIDERVRGLEARVGGVDVRVGGLDVRVGGLEARVRDVDVRVREEGIATRRHFDVVAESVRDDIRIIAEGLITLDAKVEAMRKI